MPNNTAPSGTQYLDFASSVANETCHYLQESNITSKDLQDLIEDKEKIRSIALKNADDYLHLVSREQIIRETLQQFFLDVFECALDFSHIKFPERKGFPMYMVNPGGFTVGHILNVINAKWGGGETNIINAADYITEQKRPKSVYAFAYVGEKFPDEKHLGKSYNQAIQSGFLFASAEEYLYMQAFNKYRNGCWLDRISNVNDAHWTKLSTCKRVTTKNYVLAGPLLFESGGISFLSCYADSNDPEAGPREIVLLKQ